MSNSITKDELKQNIEQYTIIDVREIDELKTKKLCTYCASGYRGNIASDELSKAGFDVVNLEGGFMAWTS